MGERKWLRDLRLRANLTQKEVADVIVTTKEHYDLIEKGEDRPSPRLAKRIGDLLGFDWVKFLEDADNE